MPTTALHTWSGRKLEPFMDPEEAKLIAVRFVASSGLIARGTVLGIVTASGLYKAYNNGNADGSEQARAILAVDVFVDANGKVTFTTTNNQVGDEYGNTYLSAPAYVAGTFKTSELIGLDAPAVTDMAGFLIQGAVSDGILRLG
jgi:hypothetical protein